MKISDATIDFLKNIVTGDNNLAPYKSGPDLVGFFNYFGFKDEYVQGFPSRWFYVKNKIEQLNNTENLEILFSKVLSPQNFISKEDNLNKIIIELNKYLKFDGYEIKITSGEIKIIKLDQDKINFSEFEVGRVKKIDDFDIEKLLSYVHHDDKYRNNLEKALNNELWDYATSLIWKIIVLFLYEKFSQISTIKEMPRDLIKKLEDKNCSADRCFSYNYHEDNFIADNITKVWSNFDRNYQKRLISLLAERNSLSHVNEIECTKIQFDAYLEKILEILDYIQDLHNDKIEKLKNFATANNVDVPYLSGQDISRIFAQVQSDGQKILNKGMLLFLIKIITNKNIPDDIIRQIKESGIYTFWTSTSYALAKENGEKIIIPLVKYFDKFEVKEILEKVFENGYNQIIPASGIENIFMELLNTSLNIDEAVGEYWLLFKQKLIQGGHQERFVNLISEIDNNLYTP